MKDVRLRRLFFVACLILPFGGVTDLRAKNLDDVSTYQFDRDRSLISFKVTELGLFDDTGTFPDYEGSFTFSRRHPDLDSVTITLDTATIQMGDPGKNDQLRGPDFFDSDHFPFITFTSTGVTKIDEENAIVIGELTLLGVTRPAVFSVHFDQDLEDDNAHEDGEVSFTAAATVKRSDFGMTSFLPFVGDNVRLQIQLTGTPDSIKD